MRRITLVALACAVLVMAAPALARADGLFASSGSLTMTSEPGDPAGRGGAYVFETPGDSFRVWSYPWDSGALVLEVTAEDGEYWFVELAAPQGELLEAKTYTGATRASFRAPGSAGIDVRTTIGCTDMVGAFTVHEVEYGPNGVLTRLRASFEQHCGGSFTTPALRGEVDLVIPPVDRAPLDLQIQMDATAKRTAGVVNLRGTVTCNAFIPVEIQVFGGQLQLGGPREYFVTGSYVLNTDCRNGVVAFSIPLTVEASKGRSNKPASFLPGEMRLDATIRADDPIFAFTAEGSQSLVVQIT